VSTPTVARDHISFGLPREEESHIGCWLLKRSRYTTTFSIKNVGTSIFDQMKSWLCRVLIRRAVGGIALLVIGVLVGNVLSSLAAPSSKIITSCVDRKTGTMRYASSGRCRSNELSVSWNVQGPTGPRGAAGDEGAQGLQGPRGPSGEASKTILSGVSAPSDAIGNVGDFYIDSSRSWIYGPKTASGWPNGTSLVGPAGSVGATGATGAPGPAGNDGPAGNTLRSGSGTPASSTGSDGDFYIDTSANKIHGPKSGGNWPAGVSLVGPTGSVGATGATGAPGPAGNDGPAGNTLRSGSGTPASSTGSDGDFYIDTSANKIHGPKSGGNWPAGVSLVGPTGSVGATGATGAPGTTLLGSNFYVVSHYQMNGWHSASCNAGDVATGGGTSPMGANYPETNASGVPTKWTSEQDYVYAVCLDLP
jgi:hypothetical protein